MSLSDAEIMEMYKKNEREGIRLMVDKYQNYVWHIINTCYPTFNYEKEDLFQNGVIGIMVAMKRFNPERSSFTTYCTPFLKKEISKQLQFITSERSAYYAAIHSDVDKAVAKLESEGKSVSIENVMGETGLSRKIVAREMKVDRTRVSLDALAVIGKKMSLTEEFVVNDMLSGLPSINKEIIRKKAIDALTFHQIARDMHMSIFSVKRRYKETIELLREQC